MAAPHGDMLREDQRSLIELRLLIGSIRNDRLVVVHVVLHVVVSDVPVY